MLRRAQLAVALILLLVLTPLAGATCGIECLAAAPQRSSMDDSMHVASAPHPCVRNAVCCHSSGTAVCSAAVVAPAVAALLSSDTNALHDAPAIAVAAEPPAPSFRTSVGHGLDGSPPGANHTANPTPLRV